MPTLTIGFTFENKPVCLYIGESFPKAEFAALVARESSLFHHVDIFRNPIPDKIYDHESIA
jgi:hypothetical protein